MMKKKNSSFKTIETGLNDSNIFRILGSKNGGRVCRDGRDLGACLDPAGRGVTSAADV